MTANTDPGVHIQKFDLSINPLSAAEVVALIAASRNSGRTLWISNYNLHALYLHFTDSKFRRACSRASVHLADGWPILQLARLAGRRKFSANRRVGSTDWLSLIFSENAPYSIVAIGASPESSRRAEEKVSESYPHISWTGYDGYDLLPQGSRSADVSWQDAVNSADIVLVGRGMPTQEYWIAENLDRPEFRGKIVANVGGCIDYIAGEQQLAPRWMGSWGLEWVYRLVKSPRRLAFRYLIEPLLLVYAVARWCLFGASHSDQSEAKS